MTGRWRIPFWKEKTFFSPPREDDRCPDQFCEPELVFISVDTSAGERVRGHPPVQETVLHKHIPIAVEHAVRR
jgi:hypothetical protein